LIVGKVKLHFRRVTVVDNASEEGKLNSPNEIAPDAQNEAACVEAAALERLRSRRRFLGKAAGVAPAAIFTLNSNAAMAAAVHSVVMATLAPNQNPHPPFSSDIFQGLDNTQFKPICVEGTVVGDFLEVEQVPEAVFYNVRQGCPEGKFLITASSAMTFGGIVTGL
jgi:hypothetical protein